MAANLIAEHGVSVIATIQWISSRNLPASPIPAGPVASPQIIAAPKPPDAAIAAADAAVAALQASRG